MHRGLRVSSTTDPRCAILTSSFTLPIILVRERIDGLFRPLRKHACAVLTHPASTFAQVLSQFFYYRGVDTPQAHAALS